MTGPEIEKRKTELYSKYYGENSRTLDNLKNGVDERRRN